MSIQSSPDPCGLVFIAHSSICHPRVTFLPYTCPTNFESVFHNQEEIHVFVDDFATLKWPHFDHYIWPHPNR
jgi:hypothetical protein